MIAKAKARYIKITPRKFRLIIPFIKGKGVEEAIAGLASINKKASVYAREVLEAALANAKRLHEGIDTSSLYVSKVIADGGPMLKRYRAASMGRANMIRKRTSHITVELDEREKTEAKPKEAPQAKKTRKKGK
jgi:large subunit ribosomal protein L22